MPNATPSNELPEGIVPLDFADDYRITDVIGPPEDQLRLDKMKAQINAGEEPEGPTIDEDEGEEGFARPDSAGKKIRVRIAKKR